MKQLFRRAVAVLLALSLLASIGVFAFAEGEETSADAETTTVSPEQALADAANDASRLAATLFRFLAFLHNMYLLFARINGAEDPYADFFIDEAGIEHIDAYLRNLNFPIPLFN